MRLPRPSSIVTSLHFRRDVIGDSVAAGWQSAVYLRKTAFNVFRLPTLSASSDGDAEGDVIEAGQASPYDHVSGRWIVLASEIATGMAIWSK